MAIVLDVIALCVVIFFLWRGKTRGFIKTVSGILILLLAFFGCGIVADYAVDPIAEQYVTPWIASHLEERVTTEGAESPSELENILVDVGVPETLTDDIIEARPVQELLNSAVNSISHTITEILVHVFAFIALLIILNLLFILIDKLFDLPGLDFANSALGLVCGGVFGLLMVYIIAFGLNKFDIIPEISNTYLLKYLLQINPLKM